MGDNYDEERSYRQRQERRMPYTGSAILLFLLAIGVFAGTGLRGWTIAVPMLLTALALMLWSLRI
jgi:hypothetical protein